MRMLLGRLAIVAAATALGSILVGWWAVPMIGAVYGLVPGSSRWPTLLAGAGAGLGWAALLVWTATQGAAVQLSSKVGAILGLPAPGLFGVTVLFAALLAGSAATLTGGLRR